MIIVSQVRKQQNDKTYHFIKKNKDVVWKFWKDTAGSFWILPSRASFFFFDTMDKYN